MTTEGSQMVCDHTGRHCWDASKSTRQQVDELVNRIRARDPHQSEFLQAFVEVADSLVPLFEAEPKYMAVLEAMAEPEQQFIFRVPWTDDNGRQQINRGFRVQFNSTLGPYKGGLRFHETVNLSVIKFLGFEQIFKNSLTTLPLGGGKGGSDFNPKGRSDNEILRFCQSFITSLHRFVGKDMDVPAGDIGVGGREIGYLFGQYKRISRQFEGAFTGKGASWGGSQLRPEATGYGAVYYLQNMVEWNKDTMVGKRCLISGSGNVSQYCLEKLLDLGSVPLSVSDSGGTLYKDAGFTREDMHKIHDLKQNRRGRLAEAHIEGAVFHAGCRPWALAERADVALPCATQNEIDNDDALKLVQCGVRYVSEGANMPSTNEAVSTYHDNKVLYGPAKAANAGGVAVSGLEMSQNSMRLSWTREEVDDKLRAIMKDIFTACEAAAEKYGHPGVFQIGANIAGFLKVADGMIDQGVV